jgi:hypothetical protein
LFAAEADQFREVLGCEAQTLGHERDLVRPSPRESGTE